ncbi:hypothetical protein ACH492_28705 [Streptomyces sp. NPDC019443]|uniref:hypothetical protein n=1 Tax=Streptomyces sp. NPDC019443 TaxID=3365061 RepID=UPI0037BDD4C9
MTNANNQEMPLDQYLLNPDQLESVSSAYSLRVAGCMHKYGLSFEAPKQSIGAGIGADAPSSRVDGRFGYQSMAHAKEWGYHPAGGFPKGETWKTSPDNDPEKWFVLTGARDTDVLSGPGGLTRSGSRVPSHGCVGSALMEITGSRNGRIGDADIATNLKFDTLVAAQKDPRTLRVFSLWSHCMQKHGYSYRSPLDALSDPRWVKSSRPSSAEIETAVADQECRARHNVVGVWFTVDFSYQERAVADNRDELLKVRKRIDYQVKAAQEILNKT